jgi:hypothetical protein
VRIDRVSTTTIKLRWEGSERGSNWYIAGATDSRWNDDDLNRLKDIPGSAFEVVRSEAAPVTPC